MLSAENVALENRAIRLMLQIREKELNYITNKYNAMGTQAALVGGFTVTTLTSISVGDHIPIYVRWAFFVTSSVSIACSISCILNATFVTVWGPGLALRGPRGSMAKAYFGMVNEQSQIFGSFVIGLLFFAIQSVVAFWIIDAGDNGEGGQGYSWCATIIMMAGGFYAVFVLQRMHGRFHALSPDEMSLRPSLPFVQELNGEAEREDKAIFGNSKSKKNSSTRQTSAAKSMDYVKKLRRFSMLGGGLTVAEIEQNITLASKPVKETDGVPSNFHGYLFKKSHHKGGMQYLHGDPWKPRWFVMAEGKLYYYETEEQWRGGKIPPRNHDNPIILGTYEVMVNPKDFDWGFLLESVGSTGRDWELRADNEKLRLAWIKVLLKASLMGGNRSSDIEDVVGDIPPPVSQIGSNSQVGLDPHTANTF